MSLLLIAGIASAVATIEPPAPPLADYQAAEAAIGEWDVDRARGIAERILGRSPDSADAYLLHARVRFLEGEYAEALREIDAAAERAIDDQQSAAAAQFREFVQPLAELAARFTVVESEHFAVHFVDGPDRVLVRRGLDVLERSYELMGETFGVRPEGKVRVEIFPDPASFQAASTLTKHEIETSGTIALCKFNRLMMLSPRQILRGFPWCDTLCHEYVHYVLWRRNGPTVPIWLHEGIAKLEESRWKAGAGSELTPVMRRSLRAALDSGDFVTFEEMHPSFAKLDDPRDVALASAEVLAVVRTVLERGDGAMDRMLDSLKAGSDWREMFEQALGQPFEEFWEAWKAEWDTRLAGVEPAEVSGPALALRDPMQSPEMAGGEGDRPDDESATAVDDTEAIAQGRHARLGDLLYQRELFRAAAIEYEQWIAGLEEPPVSSLNRVAAAHRQAGDTERALALLERSLELEPERASTLTTIGLIHYRRAEAEPAAGYLEQAAAINPFDGRIHAALADVYGALGQIERSRAARDDEQILRRR